MENVSLSGPYNRLCGIIILCGQYNRLFHRNCKIMNLLCVSSSARVVLSIDLGVMGGWDMPQRPNPITITIENFQT